MHKTSAKLFGAFLLLSFVSYATGMGQMDFLQQPGLLPETVLLHRYDLLTGAALVALLHTLFNIGLISVMFDVVRPVDQRVACAYMSAGLFSTWMLAMGAVFLLVALPVSEQCSSGGGHLSVFGLMVVQAIRLNFYAYQTGMVLWGAGGLCLCVLLRRAKLVPGFFSVWGLSGYAVFVAGACAELFGYPIGVWCSIPGGLFEIGLSVWLLWKGFTQTDLRLGHASADTAQ